MLDWDGGPPATSGRRVGGVMQPQASRAGRISEAEARRRCRELLREIIVHCCDDEIDNRIVLRRARWPHRRMTLAMVGRRVGLKAPAVSKRLAEIKQRLVPQPRIWETVRLPRIFTYRP